jgi:hypothetical protein
MNNVLEQVKTIIDEELKAIDFSKEQSKSDTSIKKKQFNLISLCKKVLPILQQEPKIDKICLQLEKFLTEKQIFSSLTDIFRFSFFIQIVRGKSESPNYTRRWSEHLKVKDPRYSRYENCVDIFIKTLSDLVNILEIEENRLNFINLQNWKNFYWIDYQHKTINESIHKVNNIKVVNFGDNQLILKIFNLENFLSDVTKNPVDYKVVKKIYEKVRTKAYYTDRSQTGDYPTNREIRWEVHLEFKGFPIDIIQGLEEEKVIGKGEITPESYKCPITMEHLLFSDFQDELLNRTHGESKFQVGHIVPRKAKSASDFQIQSGENICWISSEGNEIQQNRSVNETRNLLKKIFN